MARGTIGCIFLAAQITVVSPEVSILKTYDMPRFVLVFSICRTNPVRFDKYRSHLSANTFLIYGCAYHRWKPNLLFFNNFWLRHILFSSLASIVPLLLLVKYIVHTLFSSRYCIFGSAELHYEPWFLNFSTFQSDTHYRSRFLKSFHDFSGNHSLFEPFVQSFHHLWLSHALSLNHYTVHIPALLRFSHSLNHTVAKYIQYFRTLSSMSCFSSLVRLPVLNPFANVSPPRSCYLLPSAVPLNARRRTYSHILCTPFTVLSCGYTLYASSYFVLVCAQTVSTFALLSDLCYWAQGLVQLIFTFSLYLHSLFLCAGVLRIHLPTLSWYTFISSTSSLFFLALALSLAHQHRIQWRTSYHHTPSWSSPFLPVIGLLLAFLWYALRTELFLCIHCFLLLRVLDSYLHINLGSAYSLSLFDVLFYFGRCKEDPN